MEKHLSSTDVRSMQRNLTSNHEGRGLQIVRAPFAILASLVEHLLMALMTIYSFSTVGTSGNTVNRTILVLLTAPQTLNLKETTNEQVSVHY